MLKEKLCEIIESAYQLGLARGELSLPCPPFAVEKAEREEYGDYSSNLPLKLGSSGTGSFTIAQRLAGYIAQVDVQALVVCTVAQPGFLNFKLSKALLSRAASELVRPAKNSTGADTAKFPGAEAQFRIETLSGRCQAILSGVREAQADIVSGSLAPPLLDDSLWEEWLCDFEEARTYEPLFASDDYSPVKALIINLDNLTNIEVLAPVVSDFLDESPLFQLDLSVAKARLGLIFACKQVLSGWLGIIG